jgi:ribosomal protein L11 methylase PrmA
MLPFNTYFKYIPLYHIHVNSTVQKQFADKPKQWKKYSKTSKQTLMKFVDKLENKIKKIRLKSEQTTWSDYYKDTNYSEMAFEHKKELVRQFLKKINPKDALDLGANIGIFSRIASGMGVKTISVDNDPIAVEKNYIECVKNGNVNLLPLLIDLVNPSSGIGWSNKERMPFLERIHVDVVLVLALIHHLVISNNLPFKRLGEFFDKMCNYLVIEFIPKSDSQVQRLLSRMEDIFPDYTQKFFEDSFKEYFTILDSQKIRDSERTLYLMKRKI